LFPSKPLDKRQEHSVPVKERQERAEPLEHGHVKPESLNGSPSSNVTGEAYVPEFAGKQSAPEFGHFLIVQHLVQRPAFREEP
jgi:hypothetical protein